MPHRADITENPPSSQAQAAAHDRVPSDDAQFTTNAEAGQGGAEGESRPANRRQKPRWGD